MSDWRVVMDSGRAQWLGLTPVVRLGITLGAFIGAAVGVVFVLGSASGADTVLFSNLAPEDATQVTHRLSAMQIPFEVSAGGTAVLVPEEHVYEARLTLAGEGLPSGGTVGFEIFDEQRFGESEFAEQVKYHRALEGELARTISHLVGVSGARVHIVMPQRSLFRSAEQPATASVALRLQAGWQLPEDRVRGIVNMVASSVRGLEPERVTVLDGQGRRISSGEGSEDGLPTDAVAFRSAIEEAKARAAQEMLDATLGEGHSIVRVSADVNFTREERTEERFDPEQVAARSFQVSEERDSASTQSTGGVPGTVSNLPGGDAAAAGASSLEGVVRRNETRNFEISKIVRHAVEPVGRLRGLHVAVMVDGIWAEPASPADSAGDAAESRPRPRGGAARASDESSDEGDSRVFRPRSPEELAQIERIVASAVGLNSERGDRITVECVPFIEPEAPAVTEAEIPIDPMAAIAPYRPLVPYVLGLLGAIVFGVWWLKGGKARAQRAAARPGLASALTGPVSAQQLEQGGGVLNALAQGSAASEARTMQSEQLRAFAADLADQNPQAAAQVVRGWLGQDASGGAGGGAA